MTVIDFPSEQNIYPNGPGYDQFSKKDIGAV